MRKIFLLLLFVPILILAVSADPNWTYNNAMFSTMNSMNVSNFTYLRSWMTGSNNTFYMLDWVATLTAPFTERVGLWLYFGIWITNVAVIWMRTRDVGIPFLIVLFTCLFVPVIIPPETYAYIYLMLAVLGGVILWGVVKGGRD